MLSSLEPELSGSLLNVRQGFGRGWWSPLRCRFLLHLSIHECSEKEKRWWWVNTFMFHHEHFNGMYSDESIFTLCGGKWACRVKRWSWRESDNNHHWRVALIPASHYQCKHWNRIIQPWDFWITGEAYFTSQGNFSISIDSSPPLLPKTTIPQQEHFSRSVKLTSSTS